MEKGVEEIDAVWAFAPLSVVFLLCIAGIIFILVLAWRFVRAQERIANALEKLSHQQSE
jgi:hypothetical protein